MQICRDPFFNRSLTWDTDDPRLTQCMIDTLFTALPSAVLWILAPICLKILRARQCQTDKKPLLVTKVTLTATLILLIFGQFAFFTWNHKKDGEIVLADLIAPLVLVSTMTLALAVQIVEARRRVYNSPALFFFWLVLLLSSIPRFKQAVQNTNDEDNAPVAVLSGIFLTLVAVQFALTFNNGKSSSPSEPPEHFVSYFSFLYFNWLHPIIWKGLKRDIKGIDDVPSPIRSMHVPTHIPHFLNHWNRTVDRKGICFHRRSAPDVATTVKSKKTVSLWWVLARAYWLRITLSMLMGLTSYALQLCGPLMVKVLVRHVQDVAEEQWKGVLYAVILFVISVSQSALYQHFLRQLVVSSLQMSAALTSAVYRKSLKLSAQAKSTFDSGTITNLMSVDAQKLNYVFPHLANIWSAPFIISVALYFLYQELGSVVFAGVGIMIITIPITAWSTKKEEEKEVELMAFQDKRVKLMNEILAGIKVVKLHAWELPLMSRIKDIRTGEIGVFKYLAKLWGFTGFTFAVSPLLITLSVFALHVVVHPDRTLTAETIFVAISLFNILQFPLTALPWAIVTLVKLAVSINRINRFLNCEELDPNAISDSMEDDSNAIEIKHASFKWGDADDSFMLKDLNVTVPKGSLVAVVGMVGSGKSSLLSGILGDIQKVSGEVSRHGSVAYVSQKAWIQNMSLKDNILFQSPDDDNTYKRVLEACALVPDLSILPKGDQTEIGENGINLSGGQKQRVSIARAVYSDADIHLLDDPLSAVDAHVGRHIFEQVISSKTGLIKDKTRVLVTNHVTFLDQTDKILLMKEGKIAEMGTYQELTSAEGGAFAEFLSRCDSGEAVKDDKEPVTMPRRRAISVRTTRRMSDSFDGTPCSPMAKFLGSSLKENFIYNLPENEEPDEDLDGATEGPMNEMSVQSEDQQSDRQPLLSNATGATDDDAGRLVEDETTQLGTVSWTVYLHYLRSFGLFCATWVALFHLGGQGLIAGSSLWLAKWADANRNGTADPALYLGVYGGIGGVLIVVEVTKNLALYWSAASASQLIHNNLLDNVLKTPMSFFDTNPVGRIVNRFSSDIEKVDRVLPWEFGMLWDCFSSLVAILTLICYTLPVFTAVIIPLGAIYLVIQKCYISTSRQFRRLTQVSRSPIYSHFGETLTGVATIRAYKREVDFTSESETRVNNFIKGYYMCVAVNRWLAMRIELLSSVAVLIASMLAVLERESITPGLAGLVITYALDVTSTLTFLIRAVSDLETDLVSMERILEYAGSPQEAAWFCPETDDSLPDQWPSHGKVELLNHQLRYREGLDLVLKDITVTFEGGQKVGVCGRTGAGKSSLASGLFRLVEPAGGRVMIDGQDITKLGLQKLRSSLTIIPQDPVLFTGTIRFNVDPTCKHPDDVVWTALEHAHLRSTVQSFSDGLDYEVAENGENLSTGQRQLVCLARALLRKTKILILDEATAAIDLKTDDLIQATIRREFRHCTVVTIAHRLNTIADSDIVVVLDEGRVAEVGVPGELMTSDKGLFATLAANAGMKPSTFS